jgi:hypothetical protein
MRLDCQWARPPSISLRASLIHCRPDSRHLHCGPPTFLLAEDWAHNSERCLALLLRSANGQFTVLREGPIAADQQMTGALPAGDKRGRKTVLY